MTYTISLDEGFPAFYIYSSASDDTSTPTMPASYNDPDYFSYRFMLY